MAQTIKAGDKGEMVTALQTKLAKLGFAIKPDGAFGPTTKQAVEELQTMFGYNVDGMVGDGTQKLIDAQMGYGFRADKPEGVKRALEAQGKKTNQGALAGAALKRMLKRGMEGADVRYLQRRLVTLGIQITVDGKYGEATEQAVRKVQEAFRFTVDGIVGEGTHQLINAQIGNGWNHATA